MNEKHITTQEIIEKGVALNEKHQAYKNAYGKHREVMWKEFYEALQIYRAEVSAYVKTNPIDISDSL